MNENKEKQLPEIRVWKKVKWKKELLFSKI